MVVPQETIAAADETIKEMRESDAPASGMIALAYETLKQVMAYGALDGPRVSAAKAIIELAKQEKAETANGPVGKKAEQAAAAQKVATEPVEGWGEDLMAVVVER